jgi:hypothetical protein
MNGTLTKETQTRQDPTPKVTPSSLRWPGCLVCLFDPGPVRDGRLPALLRLLGEADVRVICGGEGGKDGGIPYECFSQQSALFYYPHVF